MTTPVTAVEYRRLADVAKETEVSWRQVDYWVRRGYIHTVPGANPAIPGYIEPIDPGDAGEFSTPGSGYTRLIDPTETAVLLLLARMVLCGLVPLVAASAARAMIEENAATVELGLGLSLIDAGVEP